MSVMGLKPWRNTAAWWITTFIELTIIMCCIALILIAGKILPKSDRSRAQDEHNIIKEDDFFLSEI